MGAERTDNPRSMLELEAQTELENRAQQDREIDINAKDYKPPIVEVDLTAESPSDSPEVSVIGKKKTTHNSRKDEFRQTELHKGEV